MTPAQPRRTIAAAGQKAQLNNASKILRGKQVRALDYDGVLRDFLKKYKYQPQLTPKLDALRDADIDQAIVNEIILWKVDRYAVVGGQLLKQVNSLKRLQHGKHRDAQTVLESLLRVDGVDLPMASTFLRFRNRQAFQIIDGHAYRAVYGSRYPLHPGSAASRKVTVYFKYLDELIKLCQVKRLPFETIDRLLYQFDKMMNPPLRARAQPGRHHKIKKPPR